VTEADLRLREAPTGSRDPRWMLPVFQALKYAAAARKEDTKSLPIIMLTARSEEANGFAADDRCGHYIREAFFCFRSDRGGRRLLRRSLLNASPIC